MSFNDNNEVNQDQRNTQNGQVPQLPVHPLAIDDDSQAQQGEAELCDAQHGNNNNHNALPSLWPVEYGLLIGQSNTNKDQGALPQPGSNGECMPPPPPVFLMRANECTAGGKGFMLGEFQEPNHLTILGLDKIVVADTNNHRIQFLKRMTPRGTSSSPEYEAFAEFCTNDPAEGEFNTYPNAVAVTSKKRVIVAQREPHPEVKIFNVLGNCLGRFGRRLLMHPRAIAVDENDDVVVLENKIQLLHIFSAKGRPEMEYRRNRTFWCRAHFPVSIAARLRHIYVCDNLNHNVKVLSYEGQLIRKIGSEWLTRYPVSVTISPEGLVMVASNHDSFRIVVFHENGKVKEIHASNRKNKDCLGVAVLHDRRQVAVSCRDNTIHFFNLHGALRTKIFP